MTRTVFISGANRGLGLALVRTFLRDGARVFAGTRTASDELDELARRHAGLLDVIVLDVTKLESVRAAAEQVATLTLALDLLVNNAAVRIESGAPLEQLVLDDPSLTTTMDVNAFGPLRVTQQFLPLLDRGRDKTIVNVSSESGAIAECGRDGEFSYCMSKAALNMQTRILHNYLKPRGYRVLAVQPGWMKTAMGGANAELDPDTSAQGILDLVRPRREFGDNIFIDYRGQRLNW